MRKYYEGREGVFFDPKDSTIFVISKRTPQLFFNTKSGKVRRLCVYNVETIDGTSKMTLITGFDETWVARLGEL